MVSKSGHFFHSHEHMAAGQKKNPTGPQVLKAFFIIFRFTQGFFWAPGATKSLSYLWGTACRKRPHHAQFSQLRSEEERVAVYQREFGNVKSPLKKTIALETIMGYDWSHCFVERVFCFLLGPFGTWLGGIAVTLIAVVAVVQIALYSAHFDRPCAHD